MEHAATVLNRYRVNDNGKTPYEEVHGQRSTQRIVEFGEQVFFSVPKSLRAELLPWSCSALAGRQVEEVPLEKVVEYFERQGLADSALAETDGVLIGASSLADEVQKRWHKIIDSPDPRGWDPAIQPSAPGP